LGGLHLRPEFSLESAPQRLEIELGELATAFPATQRKHEVIESTYAAEESVKGIPITAVKGLCDDPFSQAGEGVPELLRIPSRCNYAWARFRKPLRSRQAYTR
jgi:hypothetical protein